MYTKGSGIPSTIGIMEQVSSDQGHCSAEVFSTGHQRLLKGSNPRFFLWQVPIWQRTGRLGCYSRVSGNPALFRSLNHQYGMRLWILGAAQSLLWGQTLKRMVLMPLLICAWICVQDTESNHSRHLSKKPSSSLENFIYKNWEEMLSYPVSHEVLPIQNKIMLPRLQSPLRVHRPHEEKA